MYSIRQVTSRNFMIKGSCEFTSESSSWCIKIITSLLTIGFVRVEISCF